MDANIIITCEHAGNSIPEAYRHLFPPDADEVLASHRGWDPGAWEAASYLAERLNVPLHGCHTSRLLIEVNRSVQNPELFSEFTNALSSREKEILIRDIYQPYRDAVEASVRKTAGSVIHLSMHSFTPGLHGKLRPMDIGLLFDPARPSEVMYCNSLMHSLQGSLPGISLAFNEPYRGVDDGLTTNLRQAFPSGYSGIEIELNQRLAGSDVWIDCKEALMHSVTALRDLPPGP